MLSETINLDSSFALSSLRSHILLRIPETHLLLNQRIAASGYTALNKITESTIERLFRPIVQLCANTSLESLFPAQENQNRFWWNWREIFSVSSLKIGLLGLDASKPVPLHDHPDRHAVLVVLNGKVVIDQYDFRDATKRHEHILQLRRIHCCEKKVGGVSIVFPDFSNIHALHCISQSAVLLSMQFRLHASDEQNREKSWFFPLFPQDNTHSDVWVKKLSVHASY